MSDVIADPSSSAPESDGAEGLRGGFGSLGSIVYLLVLTWAAAIASYPLNDNSFFTHLATGRLILERGSVPSSDPYTFTAQGEPWTVQSWLASVAYAGAERLGGDLGLRLLVLTGFLAAVTMLWLLTQSASSFIGRVLLITAVLVVATDLWGERPYMVGVIGLALVWLALDGSVAPILLVPAMWVWVNAHGSFPLASVLAGSVLAGALLDRRRAGLGQVGRSREWTVLLAVIGGTLLGAVGPLGPRILLFPLEAVRRSGSFSSILEWQPPSYRSASEAMFLVLLAAAVLLLVRNASFRLALPTVIFVVGAVVAQRNVVMATVVLVPVIATCMPGAGSLRSDTRVWVGVPVAVLLAMLSAATAVAAVAGPVTAFGGYPTRALVWTGENDVDGRIATEIPAGNLLGLLNGPRNRVFIDDRVDMFPTSVFDDYLGLLNGEPRWEQILERYGIDWVVWSRNRPLASLIAASGMWAVVYSDAGWMVACRRPVCPLL